MSLLALFALVYDGIVVGAHRHALQGPAIHAGDPPRSMSVTTTDEPCLLCQAAAAAEPYLPTTWDSLAEPLPVATAIALAAFIASVLRSRAHIWRSRAPPEPVLLH
jgi:hypothetical protein